MQPKALVYGTLALLLFGVLGYWHGYRTGYRRGAERAWDIAEKSFRSEIDMRREKEDKLEQQLRSLVPPALPPPGSEHDANYQAEIVDKGDGTLQILPAPAFRKQRE